MMAIGTFGLELGATTVFLYGMREREKVLDLFELITGLRMNHAYIRPGGVSQDLPPGALERIREFLGRDAGPARRDARAARRQPALPGADQGHRLPGPGRLHGARRHRPGAAGHRAALGSAQEPAVLRLRDLRVRRARPRTPATRTAGTWSGWPRWTSRSRSSSSAWTGWPGHRPPDDPVMIADAKIGWPAQLALGPDGLGNSPDHIAHIMGQSMEALIHHFKLVTEGFRVPPGQVYAAVESPRGELGCHAVSDGGTRPYRVHFRDPSFTNLQCRCRRCARAALTCARTVDRPRAVASIDPVMGGRGQVMPFSDETRARLDADAAEIIGRYPKPRSALLPLLHLVQAEEGYVSADGIEFCAGQLGLTEAEVTAVVQLLHHVQAPAGRRVPRRRLHQHAVRDHGRRRRSSPSLREHLGVGNDETTAGRQGQPGAHRVQRRPATMRPS